jgi:hypothetical protein
LLQFKYAFNYAHRREFYVSEGPMSKLAGLFISVVRGT